MSRPSLRHPGTRAVLDRDCLDVPAPQAAQRLLGVLLVRTEDDGTETVARISETEAYRQDDPASHSSVGRTERTDAMFREPGTAYVYRSYGVHWCLNVTCEEPGVGAAVLLRSAVALSGLGQLHARRGRDVGDRDLLRGPGVLTRSLAVDRTHYGLDLCHPDSPLRLETDGWSPSPEDVVAGPRVGIRTAADKPWRFHLAGIPEVSRYTRHPSAPPRDDGQSSGIDT